MTVAAAAALAALVAVLAVGALVVADHLAYTRPAEPSGPVVIDQSGRLVATTEELPAYTAGRHRARGWW